MRDAVIVEAVRTPVGRRGGALADVHPVDLLGRALRELFDRSGADPALVEDNITGCVSQVGEQALNIARNGWLHAGLPDHVPGTTVDRQCGSSQQAAHFAAQAVISGAHDVVVASGVESMTRLPMGSSVSTGGFPFTAAMNERYDGKLVPQGVSSELIARKWNVTREEVDEIGFRSQERAQAAWREGRYAQETFELKLGNGEARVFDTDEGLRETTLEKLGSLKPAFYSEEQDAKFGGLPWITTAGNSSQISDGAAAILITTSEKAKELGLRPRARFHTFALAAEDPVFMLTAPIPATRRALERAGLNLGDIDVVEINEAFATVLAAWRRELGADPQWFDKNVNPNGGAIAIGHPLGASGARLMTTLVHEMEARGARYGLQTMCEGGGMANATILQRV